MKNTVHPKTGGAAIGGALAVLLVAIANSIHGVHLPQGVTDGIAAFLPIAGAYLTPSPDPVPAAAAAASSALDPPATWAAAGPADAWPPAVAPAPSLFTEVPTVAADPAIHPTEPT